MAIQQFLRATLISSHELVEDISGVKRMLAIPFIEDEEKQLVDDPEGGSFNEISDENIYVGSMAIYGVDVEKALFENREDSDFKGFNLVQDPGLTTRDVILQKRGIKGLYTLVPGDPRNESHPAGEIVKRMISQGTISKYEDLPLAVAIRKEELQNAGKEARQNAAIVKAATGRGPNPYIKDSDPNEYARQLMASRKDNTSKVKNPPIVKGGDPDSDEVWDNSDEVEVNSIQA